MKISSDNSPQDILDTIEAAARQHARAQAEQAAFDKAHPHQPQAKPRVDRWTGFCTRQPQEAGWILRHEATFSFAAKMREAVVKWGGLTDGQMAAVHKCMAREAAQASRPAAADLDAGSVAALRDCFDRAAANKARGAILRIALTHIDPVSGKSVCDDAFAINAAPEHGKNPGALYVKQRQPGVTGGAYIGKVFGAKFSAAQACTPAAQANFVKLCEDPGTAAIAFGKHFKACAICGQTLSNPVSLARGIGPDCAQKFGW